MAMQKNLMCPAPIAAKGTPYALVRTFRCDHIWLGLNRLGESASAKGCVKAFGRYTRGARFLRCEFPHCRTSRRLGVEE